MPSKSVKSQILQHIKLHGYITIADLMEKCLSTTDRSYYRSNNHIIGATGDFITAPDISQLFGEIIGLWAIEQYHNLGCPEKINIVELGPGRGSLMYNLLRVVKLDNKFFNALEINLLEINPYFIELQKNTLEGFDKKITWLQDMNQLQQHPTIFIANEFFDALPISQYVKLDGDWHERVIVLDNNKLQYSEIEVKPGISRYLSATYSKIPENGIVEKSTKAEYFTRLLASHITKYSGSALIIDYGYNISPTVRTDTQYNSTLQAVKNHKFHGILEDLGEVDLSTHVDFHNLRQIIISENIKVNKAITQREFLLQYGIEVRKNHLQKNLSGDEYQLLEKQVHRLINFGQMGNLFKTLSFFHKNHR